MRNLDLQFIFLQKNDYLFLVKSIKNIAKIFLTDLLIEMILFVFKGIVQFCKQVAKH